MHPQVTEHVCIEAIACWRLDTGTAMVNIFFFFFSFFFFFFVNPFSLCSIIIGLTITYSRILNNWNLKLLVIYTIEKSKSTLGSFVRNSLLTLNQETISFSWITLFLAGSFWRVSQMSSGIIFSFIANSSIGVTGVKSGLRDGLYELGLPPGLMVAYIPYKKPEVSILDLT